MSYDTQMVGVISVDPPLPYRVVKDHGLLPENVNRTRYASLKFVVAKRNVDTDEGVLTVIEVTGVEPLGSYGSYVEENLKDVLALAKLTGQKHTFSGYIEGHGEEAGDIWRLAVIDGEARKVDAVITWPDEVNF